jgi:hypothetical protein
VYWEGPGINGMQLIPASAFFHGDAVRTAVPRPAGIAPSFSLQPLVRNGRLAVRFSAPAEMRVRIDVLDISGRSVHTVDMKDAVAGCRDVLPDLSAGQYFVRLRAGKTSLLSRVMILK